jgi:hypothetical protein
MNNSNSDWAEWQRLLHQVAEPSGSQRPAIPVSKREQAIRWLRDKLSEQPRWADDIERMAREEGISPHLLRKIKRQAGVVSRRFGGSFGKGPQGWYWKLAGDDL